MKGLPKTKWCDSVAVTVSVRFRFRFGVYVKRPLGKILLFFDFSLPVKAVPHECVIRTGQPYTPIPHRPLIPRIDKYLDLWLNRPQFVKILTDLHSP